MASLQSFLAIPTRTGYAATKHAMLGFFESLRLELQRIGRRTSRSWLPTGWPRQAHERALGPDGRPFGRSLLVPSKVMTAEACALASPSAAMERRTPLAITSLRGRAARIVARPRAASRRLVRPAGPGARTLNQTRLITLPAGPAFSPCTGGCGT